MNSFERFKKLNQDRVVANDNISTKFVFNGYPSTTITSTTGVAKTAAIVNRQEKDLAYIYTYTSDPLDIGSVWSAKNCHWLISEEFVIIKNVKFHKYLAYLCNTQVGTNYGFFKGPQESAINVALKEKVLLQSQQHPILILGGQPLNIDDKILISNRSFTVQEMDNISTAGITYYTLKLGTMSKDKSGSATTGVIEQPVIENPDIISTPTYNPTTGKYKISAGIPITLSTENGYFLSSNKEVKSSNLSSTSVTFAIPFGVDEVTITTKSNGQNVVTNYEVI